jgi:hypothetical protein
MSKRSNGTRGLTTAVYDHLSQRVNQDVNVDDVAAELGVSRAQVQGALSYLRKKPEVGDRLAVVVRNVWRLAPERPSGGKRLFEEIGTAKDGRVVVQDDEGNLFVAVPL